MTAINHNSKANTLYTQSQLNTVEPPPDPWRNFNKSTRYVQSSWQNRRTRLKQGDGDDRTFENAKNVCFIVCPEVEHIQAIYNFAFIIIIFLLNIPSTQTDGNSKILWKEINRTERKILLRDDRRKSPS